MTVVVSVFMFTDSSRVLRSPHNLQVDKLCPNWKVMSWVSGAVGQWERPSWVSLLAQVGVMSTEMGTSDAMCHLSDTIMPVERACVSIAQVSCMSLRSAHEG